MATLELSLLGGLTIRKGDIPLTNIKSRKGRALFCYLAMAERPFTRSALAGLFWPDVPEGNARTNLRKALSQLRPILNPYLHISRQEIAFNMSASYSLDVKNFESLTRIKSSKEDLKEAVDLYLGDFLEGFYISNAPEFEEWILSQQTRLKEIAIQALQRLTTTYSQIEAYKIAIEHARHLSYLEPWREETHAQLMRLFALNGQRNLALTQFETCQRLLKDELNIDPTPETIALYEAIRSGQIGKAKRTEESTQKKEPRNARKTSAPALTQHNLPAPPWEFIGREKELADLNTLIENKRIRLVTIVGTSGMGKTRLALAVARSQLKNYEDGVWFVPLAAVETVEEITTAVAESLNFKFYKANQPEQQMHKHLHDKSLLLLLDNFEHLLNGASQISEILKTAPNVQIITTSRERLRLQEEQLFPIQGLPFSNKVNLVNAESYAAIQLFLQRAKSVMPSFRLRKEHLTSLTRLCQLVAGMPLGIILAAAWVEVLDLPEITDEISQSIDFLETDMQDVPERQRSIRAVFDSTWKQLTKPEQGVFQKLSIFRDSFSRQAAKEVAGASLEDLLNLKKKSLLYRTSNGRYQIHELLRQYMIEKLIQNEEHKTVSDAHCQYYSEFMLYRFESIKRMDADVIAEVAIEMNNIKKMWHHALQHQNFLALTMALRPFIFFFAFTGRFIEERNEFATALHYLDTQQKKDELHKLVLAGCLLGYGLSNVYLYHYETARQYLERSLELFRSIEFSEGIVNSLLTLGLLHTLKGDYKLAETYAVEGIEINVELQNSLAQADLQRILADALIHQTKWETAVNHVQEAHNLYAQLSFPRGIILTNILSANLANYNRQFVKAETLWQQALYHSQQLNNMHLRAWVFQGYGHFAVRSKNLTFARQCFLKSLSLLDRQENPFLRVENFGGLIKLALKENDFVQARKQLLKIVVLVESIESPRLWIYWLALCGVFFIQNDQQAAGLPLLVLTSIHSATDFDSREMAQKILKQFSPTELPLAPKSSLQLLLTKTKSAFNPE